jgi:hypothetical protein
MSDPSTFLFAMLFESALLDYEKQTGTRLTEHPLAQQLENCGSIESITVILHENAGAFSEFRRSDGRIMKSLKSVVSVLFTLSTSSVLGGAIGLVLPIDVMSIFFVPNIYPLVIPACECNICRFCCTTCGV